MAIYKSTYQIFHCLPKVTTPCGIIRVQGPALIFAGSEIEVFTFYFEFRWLTTNARSLHAVSLQLKILWYCIKWAEFMPGDDETEDGRLIVHQPDRDEIRLVIDHKEFPPQGTYERYLLQVEVSLFFFSLEYPTVISLVLGNFISLLIGSTTGCYAG